MIQQCPGHKLNELLPRHLNLMKLQLQIQFKYIIKGKILRDNVIYANDKCFIYYHSFQRLPFRFLRQLQTKLFSHDCYIVNRVSNYHYLIFFSIIL